MSASLNSVSALRWRTIALLTLLSAQVYTVMEWLFIMTKPSALSAISMADKVRIGLFTFALLALGAYVAVKLVQLAASLIKWPGGKALALLIPAALQGSLAFLLLDNFTYTLFTFGVSTGTGVIRAGYLVLFLTLLGIMYREAIKQSHTLERALTTRTPWLEVASVVGLMALLVLTYRSPLGDIKPTFATGQVNRQSLPNIILLTPDGVNASHMSVYGYERDTTPTLRELAATSLVGDNHYSNSAHTIGGLIAILASKYPSTTRVLFPPTMLRGEAMYQHLPSLLKLYGYTTYHFSHPYYADVTERGLLGGFDVVNGVHFLEEPPYRRFLKQRMDLDSALFVYDFTHRLADRLLHIAFIQPMVNYRFLLPTEETALTRTEYSDADKLRQAIDILEHAENPVFIHIHWMKTHPVYPADKPPHFLPTEQVFSVGKDLKNQEAFDLDFYDDTIYGFDKAVEEILQVLEENGKLNNTILIVTSDHGLRSDNMVRIPLLIHFPEGKFSGRITTNTQSIDIAPTILDYLGMPIPAWMEGESLLQETLRHSTGDRPLFTIAINHALVSTTAPGVITAREEPPFYSIGEVSLISCDVAYRLKLKPPRWTVINLEDSTLHCTPIPADEAYRRIVNHLRERGYDVSSLEAFTP